MRNIAASIMYFVQLFIGIGGIIAYTQNKAKEGWTLTTLLFFLLGCFIVFPACLSIIRFWEKVFKVKN
jgi:hypothetical protein